MVYLGSKINSDDWWQNNSQIKQCTGIAKAAFFKNKKKIKK